MLCLANYVLACTVVIVGLNTGPADASFKTYSNIYFSKCNQLGVYIDLDQYGIIHNDDNDWKGERSNIIYNPGLFPLIVDDYVINTGLPQTGDFQAHKDKFQAELDGELVDAYEGLLCLDFEKYKPLFRNANMHMREASISLEEQLHPNMTSDEITQKAIKNFNDSSRAYFEVLINMTRIQRPNVLVGYYGFPYCNNYNPPNTECASTMMTMNDDLKHWMYKYSTVLLPSLYTKESGDGMRMDIATHRTYHLSTEMKETQRVNDYNLPVIPYINYKFRDEPHNYIPIEIFTTVLWIIKYYGGTGAVLWNKSADFYYLNQCQEFKDYMYSTLGPILKCMDDLPEDLVQALRVKYPIFEGENEGSPMEISTKTENTLKLLMADADISEDDPNEEKAVKIILTFCQSPQQLGIINKTT